MKKIMIIVFMLPFAGFSQQKITLQECRQMAMEHNQKIKAAEFNKQAATSLKKAAFTQFLPNFNIEGTYTYLNNQFELLDEDLLFPVVSASSIDEAGKVDPSLFDQSTLVINPATGMPVTDAEGNAVFKNYGWIPADELSVNTQSYYLLNAGFIQPIYAGGKIRETYKIAGYAEDIASSKKKMTTSEVLYKVERYYWQVISLTQKVELAQKYAELLNKLVSNLEDYYDEGLITQNELLKAKVKRNEANLNLLKAQNGETLAKMALAQLIGITNSQELTLDDSELENIDAEYQNQIAKTYEARPELEILEQSVNMAQSGVNMMRSRFLPNIGLTAGYLMTNPNPYNGLKNEFGGSLSVGVVAQIPLFHWGDKKHTLHAAKAELKASELKMEETDELLALEVQQAFFQLNESVKNLKMARSNMVQAEENLQVTQTNFEEGMVKTTDILEAQALWQKAKAAKIEAQTAFILNKTLVKKVTGQLN